ncbi:hypothetical protein CKY02_22785 [Photorhabdus bodei]|uniref:Uncharacterized protein n=2 Tax=Photorhabdus bodei TaxID=2029681 RepID=A0A329WS10_9GAMM|nr:hypothetical protein CKY02_22785 [Photorhabdus bodei]
MYRYYGKLFIYIGYILAILFCFLSETAKSRNRFRLVSFLPWQIPVILQCRPVNVMARHQGNHHGYTDAIRNALDKMNLNQSTDTISKQVANIQNIAKKGMENGNIIKSKDRYNTNIQRKDVN